MVVTLALLIAILAGAYSEPCVPPDQQARTQAQDSNRRGIELYEASNLEEARKAFAQALKLDCTDGRAHRNLAATLCELGNCEAAVPHIQAALLRSPEETLHLLQSNSAFGSFTFPEPGHQSALAFFRALRTAPWPRKTFEGLSFKVPPGWRLSAPFATSYGVAVSIGAEHLFREVEPGANVPVRMLISRCDDISACREAMYGLTSGSSPPRRTRVGKLSALVWRYEHPSSEAATEHLLLLEVVIAGKTLIVKLSYEMSGYSPPSAEFVAEQEALIDGIVKSLAWLPPADVGR